MDSAMIQGMARSRSTPKMLPEGYLMKSSWKYTMYSCTRIGVPRITVMYSRLNQFSTLILESRIRAMAQPSSAPQKTVTSATKMVVRVPRRKYW